VENFVQVADAAHLLMYSFPVEYLEKVGHDMPRGRPLQQRSWVRVTGGMAVPVRLSCVCVVLCVGGDLATG
jgi:hypothetical protein